MPHFTKKIDRRCIWGIFLPLSLQYEVIKEKGEFVEVDEDYKDKVSLSINGQDFADIYASDVFGKNIIISYEPSTNAEMMISSNNMRMQTKKQV